MFDQILGKLVQDIPGASGAVFIDYEGEAIWNHPPDKKEELRLFGAYQGIAFNLIKTNFGNARFGEVSGINIDHKELRYLLYPVLDDYLLVLILDPSALYFTANRCAEQAVIDLVKELQG